MAEVKEALKLDGKNFHGRAIAVKRSLEKKEKVKDTFAKPTGKAKNHAESRSFVVQGVSAEEVSSRVNEVLHGVTGCTWEEKKDGFKLEFRGEVLDSTTKKPALEEITEDSDAYRFELSAGPNFEEEMEGDATPPVASDPDVFSVTMAFVSGSNLSRRAFWLTYEAVERDVQRTSRKWRRIAAKKGEPVPTPQAVPPPNEKKRQNLYDKNAEQVQSAVAMGIKEAMKKKKKAKPAAAVSKAGLGMGLDMFG